MTEPKGPFDAAIRAIDRALLKAKITESCQICQLEAGKAVLEAAGKMADRRDLILKAMDNIHEDRGSRNVVVNLTRGLIEALPDGGKN